MTIKLLKGYKYRFIATMVVDGKNRINTTGDPKGYYVPFHKSGDDSSPSIISNEFCYHSSTYMYGLASGTTELKDLKRKVTHPNTERFYGELENYIPNKNDEKAKIHMKRTSFGAKFIAKGKAADAIGSKLEIQITDAPKMELTIEQNNKQISDIFTFKDVDSAWSENGNYTEIIAVTINWHRTDGTVVPLGTHDITYKRNATTVVQVSVVNDTSSEGVGVEVETTSIEDNSEYDTEIEDGVIINTDVNINK